MNKPFLAPTVLAATLLSASFAMAAPPVKEIGLTLLGTYAQPNPAAAFDESAAEISAYDPLSKRLFVTNGAAGTIDVLDLSNPSTPVLLDQIDVSGPVGTGGFVGDGANSVAVSGGIVAAAVQADPVTDAGAVAFYNTDGTLLNVVGVGALPDMLTFTPNGRYVLVANEGEPDDGVDPEGSVSVIDLSAGVAGATVRHANFNTFDSRLDALRTSGVRLFPDVAVQPGDGEISVSQDLEPEYIASDRKGNTALVTLQEANSVAVLDIKQAKVTGIVALGTKDHNAPGNGLDPSDRDGGIKIDTWPLRGLFLPDAIASYQVRGQTYYVTANEGDDRGDADEPGRGDVVRFKDIEDVVSFGRSGLTPSAGLAAMITSGLQDDDQLGRLNISSIDGIDADGKLAKLFSYGARSFSIWDSKGQLVWDSGDALEQLTAKLYPLNFNASNDTNDFEDRSDNKGPEPEAVTIAKLWGRTYAFVGLERIGGVAVYDIGNPRAPQYVTYVNNRDFDASDEELEGGMGLDLGPESVVIIEQQDSPTGEPLMVVANEVSGTTSIFKIVKLKGKKGE